MRAVLILSMMLLVTNGLNAQSHCKEGEVTYFSCKIRGSTKVASLCGSARSEFEYPHDGLNAWLQYRFGNIAHPEFVFPSKKENSVGHFEGFWSSHKPISQDDSWGFDDTLSFKSGLTVYAISIAKQESEHYGVFVTTQGKNTSLPCESFSAANYGVHGDSNSGLGFLAHELDRSKGK